MQRATTELYFRKKFFSRFSRLAKTTSMPPPPAAPAPAGLPQAPLPVAEIARRLDNTLTLLLALIAAQFRLLGPITVPLWTRISRTHQRLVRALAHLAAGRTPRPPRPRASRAGRPRPRAPALSRRRGWVVFTLGYQAANLASQLNHLLRQPGAAEALAASPACARTLRPLCRMLGVTIPPALRLPPPPPRPPKPPPAAPKAEAPPPARPLQPYVRAAIRAWKRRDEKPA